MGTSPKSFPASKTGRARYRLFASPAPSQKHKILKAIPQGSNGNPGYVLNESLEVACGKNSLKIIEIQREGKKAQKINEFIQGTKIKTGSNLNNA